MPRNGTGTYSRVDNSFSNPTTGQIINPTHADAFFDDVETAMNEAPPLAVLNTRLGGQPAILGGSVAVDFNAANTDHAITITLPAGITRYRISNVTLINTGATASLTTARGGMFTAAAGGGSAIVTDAALSPLTSNAANTSASMFPMSVALNAYFDLATIYFRTSTAQGAAATGKVFVLIHPLP